MSVVVIVVDEVLDLIYVRSRDEAKRSMNIITKARTYRRLHTYIFFFFFDTVRFLSSYMHCNRDKRG